MLMVGWAQLLPETCSIGYQCPFADVRNIMLRVLERWLSERAKLLHAAITLLINPSRQHTKKNKRLLYRTVRSELKMVGCCCCVPR